MTYFVKLLGSSDRPMPNDSSDRDPEMHNEVRFPAKPEPTDVARGDEFIYYAVGGRSASSAPRALTISR